MIDGSEKRYCEGGFWILEFSRVCEKRSNEAAKLLVFIVATSGRRYGIMLISSKKWTFHFRLTSSSAVSRVS